MHLKQCQKNKLKTLEWRQENFKWNIQRKSHFDWGLSAIVVQSMFSYQALKNINAVLKKWVDLAEWCLEATTGLANSAAGQI